MIRSFANQGTEDLFDGNDTKVARKTCPQAIWSVARRKLDAVNNAEAVTDLRIPPSNYLEKLQGDRKGQWSVRIKTNTASASGGKVLTPTTLRSLIIPETLRQRGAMTIRLPTHRPPTHPGEMLLKEFIEPHKLTQTEVAQRLGISFVRLNDLIKARRGVTTDTALRLEALFGMPATFWLSLQQGWDLWHAKQAAGAAGIADIVPLNTESGERKTISYLKAKPKKRVRA